MPSNNGIATNVARTRVTVLVFNLTVISVMMSILAADRADGTHAATAHLTSFVALFTGFCLTLLGIFWLLQSQDWDAQGLSRPLPFTLGAITSYLALSQTVTAFMHEYLVALESVTTSSLPGAAQSARSVILPDALGDSALLLLLVMGGGIWVLTTYVGPVNAGIRGSLQSGRRWVFATYYFAIQVPIYWVYARAWHLEYAPAIHPMDMLSLFALQFAQPLLWFR